ncbi:MAG: GNAT family N-acetyltransferase [Lachnospiraceae bacterium]|nr:GNAT family N-acetyltransferase [Lachnospiraceae bacterium]
MLSVFVAAQHQGNKVGTQIVNHLENEVKKLNAKCMRVPVTAEDKSFYKKLGYAEAEKRKEWTDAGLCVMEKIFLDA